MSEAAPKKRARATKKTTSSSSNSSSSSIAPVRKPSVFANKFDASLSKIAKSQDAIVKAQEGFAKSLEDFRELQDNSFGELETILNRRHEELAYLEEQFKLTERQKTIETELNIKQHGIDACTAFLEPMGKIIVDRSVFEELERSYTQLRTDYEQGIRDAVAEEHAKNARHTAAMQKTLELKNAAEVAKVEAEFTAQQRQIEMLNKTIDRLNTDLDKQRDLTDKIAASTAQAASAASSQMYLRGASSGSSR